jgi:hypothetical protein
MVVLLQQQWSGETGGEAVELMGILRFVVRDLLSGRCEKIDFRLLTHLRPEKLLVRIRFERLVRLRYTFPFKNETQQNQQHQFLHILQATKFPKFPRLKEPSFETGCGSTPERKHGD